MFKLFLKYNKRVYYKWKINKLLIVDRPTSLNAIQYVQNQEELVDTSRTDNIRPINQIKNCREGVELPQKPNIRGLKELAKLVIY